MDCCNKSKRKLTRAKLGIQLRVKSQRQGTQQAVTYTAMKDSRQIFETLIFFWYDKNPLNSHINLDTV